MRIKPGQLQAFVRERLNVISRTTRGDYVSAWQDLLALGDALDALPAPVAEDLTKDARQARCGQARSKRLF